MEFSPFSASDVPELLNWHEDAELSEAIGGKNWPTKLWEILQKDPLRKCWIVRENGNTIGYVDFEEHPDENLAWIGLAVKPALRKKGFGSRILRAFLQSSDACRFPHIWAGIEDKNTPSKKCFESVGFRTSMTKPDEEGIVDYVYEF